ncbi:F510_1955 family glycosylhydrolase [Mycolicibacterium sp.]|uniref:F510_1955 family glycosylhydrolase n=1 Tax=Mycolicibacterium sp. TaxID=2320850 RepID=UPI003D0F54B6
MQPARSWRTFVIYGVLTVFAVAVVGCSLSAETAAPQTSAPPTSADGGAIVGATTLSPALAHIHGLHIDAGGVVLAGTHDGLFALDPGTGAVNRVGESDDDFMGLTGVPGTSALFSSGHPGRSSSAANPLGLRASTDGGRTWVTRSLAGEVDFHALAATDRLLVGFDTASGLRVSNDGGANWAPGAAVAASSLAITDRGVWAVTDAGLQFSEDAGLSFSAVPEAPSLAMVAGARDALWGVDTFGNAWQSQDGRDWRNAGFVGRVEALTTDATNAYAATRDTLYRLE